MSRSRAGRAAVVTLVGLLAVAGCSGSPSDGTSAAVPTTAAVTTTSTPEPAATCGVAHAAGQSRETFEFEGQERAFELYVPEGYDGTEAVPLVFDFHGYGSNAAQQMVYGDFRPLADQDGFLIVAPEGQGDNRHFNLTNEPGLQDDVAMVVALLGHIADTLCVDTDRVYSTGMSDGGAITSVLACRHPDLFGAFAPVAVILYFPGCAGTEPVAIAAFMGTDDAVVPFDGGPVQCCGGPTLGSAPDAMAGWADHNGCSPEFTEERLDTEVRRRAWDGCSGSSEVVFYIIDGGGHTWPGAIPVAALGLTTQQIDASETIWDFFQAHPRNG